MRSKSGFFAVEQTWNKEGSEGESLALSGAMTSKKVVNAISGGPSPLDSVLFCSGIVRGCDPPAKRLQ